MSDEDKEYEARVSAKVAELRTENFSAEEMLELAAQSMINADDAVDLVEMQAAKLAEANDAITAFASFAPTKALAALDQIASLIGRGNTFAVDLAQGIEGLFNVWEEVRKKGPKSGGAKRARQYQERFSAALADYQSDARLQRISFEAAAMELIGKRGHAVSHSALKRRLSIHRKNVVS